MKRLTVALSVGLLFIGISLAVAQEKPAAVGQKLGKQKPSLEDELKKEQDKLKERVPELIEWLKKKKDGVKEMYITLLSRSRDSRAIEPLAEVMLNSIDLQEREYTAKQLSGFDDKKIVPIFKKQVLENGPYKILGATVLMKLGDDNEKKLALPILEEYAKGGHPEILSYTEFNWSEEKSVVVGKRVYYNKDKAKSILNKLLSHNDEIIRARAVYYLSLDMEDKELAQSKLEEILKSDNTKVKDIGKNILKQIGDKESKKKLNKIEYQEMQAELKKAEQKKMDKRGEK